MYVKTSRCLVTMAGLCGQFSLIIIMFLRFCFLYIFTLLRCCRVQLFSKLYAFPAALCLIFCLKETRASCSNMVYCFCRLATRFAYNKLFYNFSFSINSFQSFFVSVALFFCFVRKTLIYKLSLHWNIFIDVYRSFHYDDGRTCHAFDSHLKKSDRVVFDKQRV